MRAIIGILFFLAVVVLAIYVGVWQGIVLGIVTFVEAVKETPVSSWGIAEGVVRFWLGPLVGWIIFWLGNLISYAVIGQVSKCFK